MLLLLSIFLEHFNILSTAGNNVHCSEGNKGSTKIEVVVIVVQSNNNDNVITGE